jgi:hypothetical protein
MVIAASKYMFCYIEYYVFSYDEALRLRELSKDQLDELLVKLSSLESELNLLKRRISHMETDVGGIKRENQNLIGSLQRARAVSYLLTNIYNN